MAFFSPAVLALGRALPFLVLVTACLATFSTVHAAEKASFRFLRGAYLLRQLSPGSHWPAVNIPRSVINHDTTNALALHPDKPFVMGQIARDLASIDPKKDRLPLAPYYAAYAYELLGEFDKAAAEMREYLAKAQYRAVDHFFLVRNLYRAKQYQAVRDAASRWRSLDGDCSEKRLEYVWGSYRAEARHGDAMAAVLTDPCTTWRSKVLYEDSRRELGEAHQAEAEIHKLAQSNPGGSREIYLLWNRLAAQSVYP